MSSPEGNWRGLVNVIGEARFRDDPRFADRATRINHYIFMRAELALEFLKRPRAAWIDALVEADVPCAPVKTPPEVMEDPQIQALGAFREMRLANGVTARLPQTPVLFDGRRVDAWSPAPAYPGGE